MTPASATPRRRRNRNRNASVPVKGSAASARSLAAGLWRLRHAQRMKAAGPLTKLQGRRSRGNRTELAAGRIGSHCQCATLCIHHRNHKMSAMEKEKATKWDADSHPHSPLMVAVLEAELEKARRHMSELEEERREAGKRLERFLRRLGEEKAAWKARIKDALREERAHRRQLEHANARLVREAAEARSWGRQQAQRYEAERKAREVMEAACSELTREVEEDQAEVELLRRECLRMREEMEEERRMLQMAEVWREERVQMKLSDAKLALQAKYDHLAQLQAQMEACVLRTKDSVDLAAAASSELRCRNRNRNGDSVDADSVLEHFRRKEKEKEMQRQRQRDRPANSPDSSNSNTELQSASPATDLFLAKVDDDDDGYANGGGSSEENGVRGDSCSWFGTSDRSASVANTGCLEAPSSGASRRSLSLGKNTALIRRLWRSAIADGRNKTAGGWSPPSDRRSSATAEQSLREKLMEARMDDHHAHKT